MAFHADPSVRDTRGDRGSTTRRRSTRTVRGPEGVYIAQIKEDLAARRGPKSKPPAPALGIVRTRFHVECPHPSGERVSEDGVNSFWFETEAEARARALSLPGAILRRQDQVRHVPDGKRKPRERFVWTDLPL